MKTKNLSKGCAIAFAIISLTACNGVSIEGSWIQPIPGMPELQQGFSLQAEGKASSINMATLQYETWKQENDLLILTGKSIGNHQTILFSDTLTIEKLTTDSLILKQNDLVWAYAREVASK